MFRTKHLRINTLSERVIFIHEEAVRPGNLGVRPLDRTRVGEVTPLGAMPREVTGILNFCEDTLIAPDEVSLSIVTARELLTTLTPPWRSPSSGPMAINRWQSNGAHT